VPSVEVETAEAVVADLEARLAEARRAARRHERRHARLIARVNRIELLSHRLTAERDAAQIGYLSDDAAATVSLLERELADAEEALELARQGALAATVAPGLAGLAPSFVGDYVFPVGGGPDSVSVGHDHHDYPAADIAAPQGAPLFALTDGVVIAAWPHGNGNCGIGFTLGTGDGREWTYCHMSLLDPTVATGVTLPAGAPVGLVGSTGHSTGPHLHLQLQPATSYPQDEPWFQAFAGTAFAWQDAPRSDSPAVFAVVEDAPAVEFFHAGS
jgi:murein DD-endopeptidase MepM/ murein hydrolase activator NlpD